MAGACVAIRRHSHCGVYFLLAQLGQTLLPETLCAQQLRLIETCEQYRRANVSVKHIFGLLSVSGVQARVQK